jgi:serine/threonine protein kinase
MVQHTVLPLVELDGAQARVRVDPRRRYQVEGKLGEGGVGEVLSAMDHDIGRRVAIKRLHGRMRSPLALARFVEEIRTTGRLEHPNVVPIHDVGVDDQGEYYFVMKHVDGETLESIIARLRAGDPDYHQRYGFQRRVEIFKGVLEAVHLAHSEGIIHRDIKPANVMVGSHGEVLLMDWGLAKSLRGEIPDLAATLDTGAATPDTGAATPETGAATPDTGAATPDTGAATPDTGAATPDTESSGRPRPGAANEAGVDPKTETGTRTETRAGATPDRPQRYETQAGSLLGTPAYMSPEQAQGLPADERSDIYSLGVLFHELLTLQHYLADKQSVAEVLAAVGTEPVPLAAFVKTEHQSAVPADLTHFVKVAVAKDPAARYPSVRAMLERLDRRAEGEIPVECPMTLVKVITLKFTKALDAHPFWVLGLLMLALLGGLGALILGLVGAAS